MAATTGMMGHPPQEASDGVTRGAVVARGPVGCPRTVVALWLANNNSPATGAQQTIGSCG